ncbi:MAG TPA: universal stress protein [Burkholderiaceae bacterium]|nr:universal stress protein [Burkholderiaceae bacterium]
MKILLPVDGSENALDAVRHALRLAGNGLHARYVLANVQEPASLYEVVVAHSAEVIQQVSAAAAEHALAPAQALLRAAGLAFDTEIGHGDPGHQIVEIAERCGCDLIILGARGMAPLEGALGSAANSVLHHAGVPVMVVRRNPG